MPESRKAFEEWAKPVYDLETHKSGQTYADDQTRALWRAWQAAWNTRHDAALAAERERAKGLVDAVTGAETTLRLLAYNSAGDCDDATAALSELKRLAGE